MGSTVDWTAQEKRVYSRFCRIMSSGVMGNSYECSANEVLGYRRRPRAACTLGCLSLLLELQTITAQFVLDSAVQIRVFLARLNRIPIVALLERDAFRRI